MGSGPMKRQAICRNGVLLAVALVTSLSWSAPSAAQQGLDPRPAAMNLTWWHPVAAGAGVTALFLIDRPLRDAIQRNQSDFLSDVSDVAKTFKDPPVYAVAAVGTAALGLVVQDPKITVTGLHIAAAYGIAGGMHIGSKWVFGRSRPNRTPESATNFDFWDGDSNSSFPSGSAAVTFSLATILADAIDRKPVTILVYSAATLNSWSRLYGDRHWLSDVAFGALIGVTSAKLVNGSWTVFGLRPPTLWTDGQSMSMGYTIPLR